jgi:predicted TIM-barrel fold metal-dependent hydrolase
METPENTLLLPDGSPLRIIDSFRQLHEGSTSHDIPMMPREALRDDDSLAVWPSSDMVGHLFRKDPAADERNRICSDLGLWLEYLDKWNISVGGIPITPETPNEYLDRLTDHSDRLFVMVRADPHQGMRAVRRIAEMAKLYPIVRAVSLTPFQIYPQIALNSKEYYPIYTKCVEMELAISANVGFPGPRVPAWTQDPIHLDEVAWFFPELTIVLRHGGEPWVDVCVKMLERWPNMYYKTTAFAPKYYPKEIIDYANTRGADKIIYAGYFPLIGMERSFAELQALPLRDHVWRKMFYENARSAFRLDLIPAQAERDPLAIPAAVVPAG